MPQLDFNNPLTIAQVVWMFVIFGLLYLLMSRWALPGVARVVEERATRITNDLETAREAKADADEAIRHLLQATRVAHAEAQGEIAAAIAKAKAEAQAQAREMGEKLDAQIAGAEAQIAEARRAAMGALRQVATETAQLMVARVAGIQANNTTTHSAVDQALALRSHA